MKLTKLILSIDDFDDKRFVLDDKIHTLAYFHKDVKKQILTDYYKQEEIHKDSHRSS